MKAALQRLYNRFTRRKAEAELVHAVTERQPALVQWKYFHWTLTQQPDGRILATAKNSEPRTYASKLSAQEELRAECARVFVRQHQAQRTEVA